MPSRAASKQALALDLVEDLLRDLDADKVKIQIALQRLKRVATLIGREDTLKWISVELEGYPIRARNRVEARTTLRAHFKDQKLTDEQIDHILDAEYVPIPDYRLRFFSGEYGYGGDTVVLGSALGDYIELYDTLRKNAKVTYTFDHEGKKLIWSSVRLGELIGGVRNRLYDEAARIHEMLLFGQIPSRAVEATFTFVDDQLFRLIPSAAERLTTAYQNLADRNEENWINVVDTCRRVIKDFADVIYKPRKTSQHGMAVTDDKYLNRIRAFIRDKISSNRTLQQADAVLTSLAELLAKTDNLASRSVHLGSVTRFEAERILLYTYLSIGDVLVLTGLATRPDAVKNRPRLSSATVEELRTKLGLSKSQAEAIVRARRGRLSSWDAVAGIPGIGPKTLARLREVASL